MFPTACLHNSNNGINFVWIFSRAHSLQIISTQLWTIWLKKLIWINELDVCSMQMAADQELFWVSFTPHHLNSYVLIDKCETGKTNISFHYCGQAFSQFGWNRVGDLEVQWCATWIAWHSLSYALSHKRRKFSDFDLLSLAPLDLLFWMAFFNFIPEPLGARLIRSFIWHCFVGSNQCFKWISAYCLIHH
jgi:hypothetical protein